MSRILPRARAAGAARSRVREPCPGFALPDPKRAARNRPAADPSDPAGPGAAPTPDAAEAACRQGMHPASAPVARPPRPGTVAYADAVISVHLADIEIIAGQLDEDELLV